MSLIINAYFCMLIQIPGYILQQATTSQFAIHNNSVVSNSAINNTVS